MQRAARTWLDVARRHRELTEPALVVGFFVLATAVMTYPVITGVGRLVPGWPGDSYEFLWKLWYVRHALLDEGRFPLVVPEIYYPFGLSFAGTEFTLTATLLGLPLTVAFGDLVSYDVLTLASFVLTGVGVALLVRTLTGSWVAGIVGGLAFAFTDYRLQRFGGHLNLIQTQWPVFAFYFTERWLQTRSVRHALLAGVMIALSAFATIQYALALGLLLPLYVLVRGWPWGLRLRDGRTWHGLALGALGVSLTLPLVVFLVASDANGLMEHPFASVDTFSATITDLVVPMPHHPLASLFPDLRPYFERSNAERSAYLGTAALLLGLFGFAANRHNRAAQGFAVVGLLAALLALGPTVHGPNGRLYVDLPPVVGNALVQAGVDGMVADRLSPDLAKELREGKAFVPGPATLLVMTDKLNGFRTWGRFAGFAAFAVAVLAGFGTASLTEEVRRRRAPAGRPSSRNLGFAVGAVLAALVLVDQSWLPFPTFELKPRAVDLWLAQQPGQFAVMHYPVSAGYNGMADYSTRVHGKSITYGYATFPPLEYRSKEETLGKFPDQEALSLLRDWNVRYVLVTPDASDKGWDEMRGKIEASPYLEFATEQDGILVYRLVGH